MSRVSGGRDKDHCECDRDISINGGAGIESTLAVDRVGDAVESMLLSAILHRALSLRSASKRLKLLPQCEHFCFDACSLSLMQAIRATRALGGWKGV